MRLSDDRTPTQEGHPAGAGYQHPPQVRSHRRFACHIEGSIPVPSGQPRSHLRHRRAGRPRRTTRLQGAQILSNFAGLRNEQGVDQKVRGLQGVPSRLGHVHAYQTISSSRALSAMLKNQ